MSNKKTRPFIPLSIPCINGNEEQYVRDCIRSGWVADGVYIKKFEDTLARYVGSAYAVACANGTAGLMVALRILNVLPGDEVLVPALTFIAPVNVIKYLFAEPVFIDCDDSMNIDPAGIEAFCREECHTTKQGLINKKTGRRVSAIIPVHIFGNPCTMEKIMSIAKKYRLNVVEDATESLGSVYNAGRYKGCATGTIADIGIFSFNGNKIITTGGGGMIVTRHKNMAVHARYLINQAKDDELRYIHHEIGYNFRLSNIQAAIGLAQMERIEDFIETKKKNFCYYQKGLKNIPGISMLEPPKGTKSNYWFYALLVDSVQYGCTRDVLMEKLQKHGIQSRPVWYLNHLQKPYRANQSYHITKALWFLDRVLNVPCTVQLKKRDIDYIASVIAGK